jgi:hypothetical protein
VWTKPITKIDTTRPSRDFLREGVVLGGMCHVLRFYQSALAEYLAENLFSSAFRMLASSG